LAPEIYKGEDTTQSLTLTPEEKSDWQYKIHKSKLLKPDPISIGNTWVHPA